MKTNFVYTSEYRELDLKFMYKTTHPGMKLATRLRNLVLETGLRARDSLCYRVARFFLVQNTKTGENIPNYHKLYQMAIKYFQWQ
jgi:hypothetical protein